jgi:hypothetical protein
MAFVSSARRRSRACLVLALAAPAGLSLTAGRTAARAQSRAGDAGSGVDASAAVCAGSTPGPDARKPPRPRRALGRERPPRVRAQLHHVHGALDAATLEKTLRRYFGVFRLCYESALRSDPNLAGRIAMALEVAPDGTVASAEADAKRTTLLSDAVVTCLLRDIRRIPLPARESPPTPTEACVDLDFDVN